MTTVYGQSGQPVGSVDAEGLHDAKGSQIAENHDGLLFFVLDTRDTKKGEFAGSLSSGVVYNAHGIPQGFTRNAQRGLPLLSPRMGMLTARIRSLGPDVRNEPNAVVPPFLKDKWPGSNQARDGFFS